MHTQFHKSLKQPTVCIWNWVSNRFTLESVGSGFSLNLPGCLVPPRMTSFSPEKRFWSHGTPFDQEDSNEYWFHGMQTHSVWCTVHHLRTLRPGGWYVKSILFELVINLMIFCLNPWSFDPQHLTAERLQTFILGTKTRGLGREKQSVQIFNSLSKRLQTQIRSSLCFPDLDSSAVYYDVIIPEMAGRKWKSKWKKSIRKLDLLQNGIIPWFNPMSDRLGSSLKMNLQKWTFTISVEEPLWL